MRRVSDVLLCAVLGLVVAGGCIGPGGESNDGRGVVENRPKLPEIVVGTWQAQDSPWRITLGAEGVVSAVIPLGVVQIRPNQVTEVEMKDGSVSTYKAGDCYAEYNPLNRELFVSIEIEELHIRFMDEKLEGNSIDRFIGTVSEDGQTWDAELINIFDYGPRFPQGENGIYPEPMVFEKVVEEEQ